MFDMISKIPMETTEVLPYYYSRSMISVHSGGLRLREKAMNLVFHYLQQSQSLLKKVLGCLKAL
jgi:hypothetical protein